MLLRRTSVLSLVFIAVAGSAAAQNLVVNPGFENGTSPWTPGPTGFFNVAAGGYSGSYSGHCEGFFSLYTFPEHNPGSFSQTFALPGASEYTLHYRVKYTKDALAVSTAHAEAVFRDAGGAQVALVTKDIALSAVFVLDGLQISGGPNLASAVSCDLSFWVLVPDGDEEDYANIWVDDVYFGLPEPISACFLPSATTVNPTVTVNFTNCSSGAITSYSWDFGDGNFSSQTNPSHAYNDSGTYDVRLIITGFTVPDTATAQIVVRGGEPAISAVSDIPADQGGRVRLGWSRSYYDRLGSPYPIVQYSVFRRIDTGPASVEAGPARARSRSVLYPPGDWDYVVSIPARTEDAYNTVVPTLVDSSIAGGMRYSVFFVSAETSTPGVFFDSSPDSGYSVDNLAPAVPLNLVLAGDVLNWDDPTDPDFNYFSIYGAPSPEPAGRIVLGHTTESQFTGPLSGYPYVQVTATDFAGNEGDAAVFGVTTGVDVPSPTLRLLGAAPNPFGPWTVIRFETRDAGPVSLEVFDVTGRRVSRLLRGPVLESGSHAITWTGRDEAGRALAAGIYIYRLVAGGRAVGGRVALAR